MTDYLTTLAERAAIRPLRFVPLALAVCLSVTAHAPATAAELPSQSTLDDSEGIPATSASVAPTAPLNPRQTAASPPEPLAEASGDHGQADDASDELLRVARKATHTLQTDTNALEKPAETHWVPATVLSYGEANWSDVTSTLPIEPEVQQPIPLLIWDAVGGPKNVTSAERGVVATSEDFSGDLVPPQESTPELARADISPSVAARPQVDSDTSLPDATKAEPLAASIDPPDSESAENVADNDTNSAALPLYVPRQRQGTQPRVVITREMNSLRPRLAKTLQFYFNRPLNSRDDGPWSTMHSLLGYGMETPLALNGPRGARTNALRWMTDNQPCAGRQMLYLDGDELRGQEGQGYQGHPAQFLAVLAQIGTPADHTLKVNDQSYSVEDLIRAEMQSCRADRELTFTLIALSHYLDSSATWTTEDGENWNLGKILSIELSQPVNGAACGGTHRIMAISYALQMRGDRGEPIEGAYVRAQKYVRDYQRYAMSLQLRSGGFSSDWFKRRSDWGDINRQLQTTGHILEWLVFSLPRNELSDRRLVRAVNFLSNHMTKHRFHDWEVGPRGHALRALTLYQQRVFRQSTAQKPASRDQVAWSGLRLRF